MKEKDIFTDEELLPISALQHFAFCPRQCALIHIEGIWHENYFTAQGRNLHERVDKSGERAGAELKVEYALLIRSYRLGVYGKADVVEFHLKNRHGKPIWIPYPVEYKRGQPKQANWDRIQLCAQAICLEEQLDIDVEYGAIFYGKVRRREEVTFDKSLRKTTQETAFALHKLINTGKLPMPERSEKCTNCSLLDYCMPILIKRNVSVNTYITTCLESM